MWNLEWDIDWDTCWERENDWADLAEIERAFNPEDLEDAI